MSRPACGAGRKTRRVDVRKVDDGRDLAARRKDRPRLDQAILDAAADRRPDRRVVDDRPQLLDPGVGGLDGRARFVDLRLRRLQRRVGALQLLLTQVVSLARGPALVDQRRRATHLLVRKVELGLVACDRRLAGDERLAGEFGRSLGLVQLRGGLGRCRSGRRPRRRHEVALVRNDLDDTPGNLRRDVDLRRLDPAVDADDAGAAVGGPILRPGVVAAGAASSDRPPRLRKSEQSA